MSDIAAQLAAVQAEYDRLPSGLRQHVERVAAEARDLAARWDLDPARVELAAWGHDLFRAHPPAEQLRLAAECGLPVSDVDRLEPVLLHGPIAAVVLRERFGVTDGEALAAVRDHTLGAAEMPLIAKVILLADKVEPRKRKRDPILRAIRRLARRDLDTALLCWADWKWVEERARGWPSHPAHWDARRRWVAEHHLDRAMPPILPLDPADPDFAPAE
ncbi:bis(5'-nucleosyl)-tetraphosphatase (symmetrical) YqeK [Tepidiforma flava]|uniref:Bis(5'-nucleosyl)-tetraphosphatase (Symmetrical) YqeK n=1 Tax=Tepidiforma flava TaxID=3004094 RepID=A0ABY7M835_9CHLR|nr:bis(5'-nucleosyl)-tetraphosphatase (symmetrical) YqeK [Tepidiforma flava]WBL36683.1 bis(5'-nucleosyl)-tetraphosphatase (symmetrical) YqeK [Tepidiforma flava]